LIIEESYIEVWKKILFMDSTMTKNKTTTVPLSLPAELNQQLDEAAAVTHLTKQALMRLSIERGLEQVLKALALTPEQIARATDDEAA
jgi:predicted DNA-binding protein